MQSHIILDPPTDSALMPDRPSHTRPSRLPAASDTDKAVDIALQQMHKSIADEPLPADLEALLRQIDETIDTNGKAGA